jgi:hypothetical protein
MVVELRSTQTILKSLISMTIKIRKLKTTKTKCSLVAEFELKDLGIFMYIVRSFDYVLSNSLADWETWLSKELKEHSIEHEYAYTMSVTRYKHKQTWGLSFSQIIRTGGKAYNE